MFAESITDKKTEILADVRADYWLYRFLSPRSAAYAQLARLDRPAGRQFVFWASVWGLLLGFYMQGFSWREQSLPILSKADFLPVSFAYYHDFSPLGFFLWTAFLFLIGAALMRGAGCVLNDVADYRIDAKVKRTMQRPLPSRRVGRLGALIFMALLSLAGLLILLQLNRFTIAVGLCSLVPVGIYPFVKRVSNWPQAMLGLALNWGILVGFAAICNSLTWQVFLLYAAAFFWTIGFDTIYAHQDREDDVSVGIGSTALLFGRKTRGALAVLYALTVILLFAAFLSAGAGLWALSGVVLAAGCLFWQIKRFDMDNRALCLALFKSNVWIGRLVAVTAFIGLF